jgi:hypothetical protein
VKIHKIQQMSFRIQYINKLIKNYSRKNHIEINYIKAKNKINAKNRKSNIIYKNNNHNLIYLNKVYVKIKASNK